MENEPFQWESLLSQRSGKRFATFALALFMAAAAGMLYVVSQVSTLNSELERILSNQRLQVPGTHAPRSKRPGLSIRRQGGEFVMIDSSAANASIILEARLWQDSSSVMVKNETCWTNVKMSFSENGSSVASIVNYPPSQEGGRLLWAIYGKQDGTIDSVQDSRSGRALPWSEWQKMINMWELTFEMDVGRASSGANSMGFGLLGEASPDSALLGRLSRTAAALRETERNVSRRPGGSNPRHPLMDLEPPRFRSVSSPLRPARHGLPSRIL